MFEVPLMRIASPYRNESSYMYLLWPYEKFNSEQNLTSLISKISCMEQVQLETRNKASCCYFRLSVMHDVLRMYCASVHI